MLVGTVLAVSLIGCSSDEGGPSCQGTSAGTSEYSVNDYKLLVFKSHGVKGKPVDGNEYNADDPISFDSLRFSLEVEKETITKKFDTTFDFSLVKKAYACSPVLPYTEQRLKEIKITSTADFSDDLPAGTSLNDVFDVVYINDVNTPYYSSDNSETVYFSVSSFLKQPNIHVTEVTQLALNIEPTYKQNHIFLIEVTLQSEDQFILESREISFSQ